MAKNLIKVVNQYAVGNTAHLPKRCLLQWEDDATNEEGQTEIEYADMTAGQKNVFDNYKTMVEKFMGAGNTLQSVVNQYALERVPERTIIQWFNDTTGDEDQTIENRVDMGSPDKQIFDTYKLQCENLML